MKLGVHVSISGDLSKAAGRAKQVGCETMQIFTSNPKGWNFKVRSEEEINEFKQNLTEFNIGPVFGHAIYLTNLASQNPYIYTNSINSLTSGMVLAKSAGLDGVITHIGSHGGAGEEAGFEKILNALEQVLQITNKDQTMILLETDSGSGNHIGGRFEDISHIIKNISSPRLGVCLDTCHIFSAGYDIRANGLTTVLEEFDETIGLDKLKVLHLNDSRGELGSHLDRHEEIGKGLIGLETFEAIINHPALSNLSGILETPDNKDTVAAEELGLNILKSLRK